MLQTAADFIASEATLRRNKMKLGQAMNYAGFRAMRQSSLGEVTSQLNIPGTVASTGELTKDTSSDFFGSDFFGSDVIEPLIR